MSHEAHKFQADSFEQHVCHCNIFSSLWTINQSLSWLQAGAADLVLELGPKADHTGFTEAKSAFLLNITPEDVAPATTITFPGGEKMEKWDLLSLSSFFYHLFVFLFLLSSSPSTLFFQFFSLCLSECVWNRDFCREDDPADDGGFHSCDLEGEDDAEAVITVHVNGVEVEGTVE